MSETEQTIGSDRLSAIPQNASRYEVLGVPRDASAEDIRVAYRRMALLYHPDRHPEADRDRAGEAFKRIASAYQTLFNPTERRRYDAALDRGERFHEAVAHDTPTTLSEILAGIDVYEHIFSADGLAEVGAAIQEIVMPRILAEMHEQVVGVWKMPAAPAGVSHPGTFTAGAVVLTNLRVLLPYTYAWEETTGNTKYRYRGAAMPTFVLPLIQSIAIVSQKRVRNTIWVEIRGERESIRFRPGPRNLSKLLLIARLWGIPIDARQEEAQAEEWQWALLSPWKWAAGTLAGALGLAAAAGIFVGGILDNPIDLTAFVWRNGLWPWYAITWAAVSARRVWRCVSVYHAAPLLPAQDPRPETNLVAAPV